MDEVKDFANKFVKLTIAQADMQVYKHLHDYMKKYAQKLQRDLNDVKQRLAKLEKKDMRVPRYLQSPLIRDGYRSALPLATRSALPLIRASASLKNGTQECRVRQPLKYHRVSRDTFRVP